MTNAVLMPDQTVDWIRREGLPPYALALVMWVYRSASFKDGVIRPFGGRRANASFAEFLRSKLGSIKNMYVPSRRQVDRVLNKMAEAGFIRRDSEANKKEGRFIAHVARRVKKAAGTALRQATGAAAGLFFDACPRLVSKVSKSETPPEGMSKVHVQGSGASYRELEERNLKETPVGPVDNSACADWLRKGGDITREALAMYGR